MSRELAPGERKVKRLVDFEEGRKTDLKPSIEILEKGPGQLESKEVCQTVLQWSIKLLKDSVPGVSSIN